ncbi:hypothetical protein [Streptomyces sp. NPDC056132]|uniref:hypothetical protein n=1 Tax=Streptomyces sp. NPDC056132 TaxID=3345722 RepID=UPI0035DCE23D
MGIQADRQMDVLAVLAAAVSTCATGRSAAKVHDIAWETGLERHGIQPTLRFLTGTGLLTSSPAGWTPTVSGVRVGQAWATNRDAGRSTIGEVWRESSVYRLLAHSSVRPGTALSAEEIARAMRPYQTSKLTPWIHLVDWLELARYVERDSDGSLRLSNALNDDRIEAATPDAEADEPPAPTPDSGSPPLGLVLPVNMDQLTHLTAEDYGAVMRSLATIYEVLSRQRT